MERKKSPAPEGTRLTTICVKKQTVNGSLQEFQSGVKVRAGHGTKKELIAYFHRDGKPGMKINFTPERKKELTPAEIRKGLKGGNHEGRERR